MGKFKKVFCKLADPRAANARHELWQILFIALAAVLGGAKSCCEMELFGRSKEELFRDILQLEHDIPSHDTFSRVFRLLDPEAFEKAFRQFMAAFAKANGINLTGVVAIDGKALRGAYERGKVATPLHMVNVFATEARMALASRKAPGRNEAKGALELLAMLSLEDCIVTSDALHCSRPFAAAVLARGANYVLALKENQKKLFDAVARRFARGGKRSVAKRREPSTHDRHEIRHATVIRDTSVGAANRFPGWRPWPALHRADVPVVGEPKGRLCATTCFRSPSRPTDCCTMYAVTGGSRTGCIGSSTLFSPRTPTGPERTTLPRTSRYCEGWRSILFAIIPPKPLCDRRSNAQAGTMLSFSRFSPICDSPALQGEGRRATKSRARGGVTSFANDHPTPPLAHCVRFASTLPPRFALASAASGQREHT